MSDAIGEAIEGMVQLTNDLMKKAQAELKITTDKMQNGTLTANDAVDSLMRASTFWVTSMASVAVKGLDTAAILAKFVSHRTLTSKAMTVGQPGPWTLALTGPLTNAQKAVLGPPAAIVEVVPAAVKDGATETFVVQAKVQQVGGGLYVGEVTATDPSGKTVPLVAKIQVG
jgi:hypothetical protein